jgi:uncharacterized protein
MAPALLRLPLLLLLLALSLAATAAPQFPALGGRVVDQAGLLGGNAAALAARLAQFEQASGIQLVVVTLPDLQGYPIEEFGYQLGRHWGIGHKGKDNGVLLIVAQAERRVRIEVGYGLEGALTDALAANIIHSETLPRFKRGQFAEGIDAGVTAVQAALQGEYEPRPAPKQERPRGALMFFLLLMVLFALFTGGLGGGGGFGRRGGGWGAPYGGGWGGGGGGFGGGGFGGGGGGFGGGGASGGW